MRLVIPALFLVFVASHPSLAQPQPSPTSAETKLDRKSKKEVAEVEKKLGLAMAKRDTAVLARILADSYFDTFEGTRKAMSKAGTIARCQAGVLDFPAIEQNQQLSRNLDTVTVEGQAKFTPTRVDDSTPENQWVEVRRLWTKKDGTWLLSSQVRRLLQ